MSGLKVNQIYNTSNVEQYLCKAWVNFNGTGTVAIRASGNVSSITDNGTGDYRVNFTNAMPDTNYVTITGASDVSWGNKTSTVSQSFVLTTSVRVYCFSGSGSTSNLTDPEIYCAAIFR